MKTLALTPWPIYPAMSGGQERCWNLLTRAGEITTFALDWQGNTGTQQFGDMQYRVISADSKAQEQASKLMDSGIKTLDPIPTLTRNNLTTLRREIDKFDPDLIILEHPWLLEFTDGRPYIYDSHNCETVSTGTQRPHSLDMDLVANIERRAVQQAEAMTYTSQRDLKDMQQLFPFTTPTYLVPNGVDIPKERATGEELNLVFIGSLYGPNVQAAQMLISLAQTLKQYKIRIIGQVCSVLETTADNVELLGQVTDKQLDYYLKTSFAFVNLTNVGSGTHLKVGRALAYGLPVITTPIGKRGYVTPLETIPAHLPDMLSAVRKNWQHFSDLAYEEAQTITWDKVAINFREAINNA